MNQRKARFIGTRSHVNVVAGKIIRQDEHGFDNFSDYFTDSDDEESDVSTPFSAASSLSKSQGIKSQSLAPSTTKRRTKTPRDTDVVKSSQESVESGQENEKLNQETRNGQGPASPGIVKDNQENGKSDEKATNDSQEHVKLCQDSAKPNEERVKTRRKSVKHSQESTIRKHVKSSQEPVKPIEPVKIGQEPDKPSQEPVKATIEPVEISQEPGKPSNELVKNEQNPTKEPTISSMSASLITAGTDINGSLSQDVEMSTRKIGRFKTKRRITYSEAELERQRMLASGHSELSVVRAMADGIIVDDVQNHSTVKQKQMNEKSTDNVIEGNDSKRVTSSGEVVIAENPSKVKGNSARKDLSPHARKKSLRSSVNSCENLESYIAEEGMFVEKKKARSFTEDKAIKLSKNSGSPLNSKLDKVIRSPLRKRESVNTEAKPVIVDDIDTGNHLKYSKTSDEGSESSNFSRKRFSRSESYQEESSRRKSTLSQNTSMKSRKSHSESKDVENSMGKTGEVVPDPVRAVEEAFAEAMAKTESTDNGSKLIKPKLIIAPLTDNVDDMNNVHISSAEMVKRRRSANQKDPSDMTSRSVNQSNLTVDDSLKTQSKIDGFEIPLRDFSVRLHRLQESQYSLTSTDDIDEFVVVDDDAVAGKNTNVLKSKTKISKGVSVERKRQKRSSDAQDRVDKLDSKTALQISNVKETNVENVFPGSSQKGSNNVSDSINKSSLQDLTNVAVDVSVKTQKSTVVKISKKKMDRATRLAKTRPRSSSSSANEDIMSLNTLRNSSDEATGKSWISKDENDFKAVIPVTQQSRVRKVSVGTVMDCSKSKQKRESVESAAERTSFENQVEADYDDIVVVDESNTPANKTSKEQKVRSRKKSEKKMKTNRESSSDSLTSDGNRKISIDDEIHSGTEKVLKGSRSRSVSKGKKNAPGDSKVEKGIDMSADPSSNNEKIKEAPKNNKVVKKGKGSKNKQKGVVPVDSEEVASVTLEVEQNSEECDENPEKLRKGKKINQSMKKGLGKRNKSKRGSSSETETEDKLSESLDQESTKARKNVRQKSVKNVEDEKSDGSSDTTDKSKEHTEKATKQTRASKKSGKNTSLENVEMSTKDLIVEPLQSLDTIVQPVKTRKSSRKKSDDNTEKQKKEQDVVEYVGSQSVGASEIHESNESLRKLRTRKSPLKNIDSDENSLKSNVSGIPSSSSSGQHQSSSAEVSETPVRKSDISQVSKKRLLLSYSILESSHSGGEDSSTPGERDPSPPASFMQPRKSSSFANRKSGSLMKRKSGSAMKRKSESLLQARKSLGPRTSSLALSETIMEEDDGPNPGPDDHEQSLAPSSGTTSLSETHVQTDTISEANDTPSAGPSDDKSIGGSGSVSPSRPKRRKSVTYSDSLVAGPSSAGTPGRSILKRKSPVSKSKSVGKTPKSAESPGELAYHLVDAEAEPTPKKRPANKIIRPRNTPSDLRRSRRTRVLPLAWYKNERIKYSKRNSGGFQIDNVLPPLVDDDVQKKKRKRKYLPTKAVIGKKRKRLSMHTQLSHSVAFAEYEGNIPVIFPESGEEVLVDCVATNEQFVYCGPNSQPPSEEDHLLIAKPIQQPAFSCGSLIIRGLQHKPRQFVNNDTLIFNVTRGKVAVTIHETTVIVDAGGIFFVPRGNWYSIKNLRRNDAELSFTQLKNPSQSDDET